MGSWIFFRTSLVHSITYILVIKIGWAVFKKIKFFDFSKFVHNFCKKDFFELILGVNLSCNGSHLPSQYGSNPSEDTQTMLILLRPLTMYRLLAKVECLFQENYRDRSVIELIFREFSETIKKNPISLQRACWIC